MNTPIDIPASGLTLSCGGCSLHGPYGGPRCPLCAVGDTSQRTQAEVADIWERCPACGVHPHYHAMFTAGCPRSRVSQEHAERGDQG